VVLDISEWHSNAYLLLFLAPCLVACILLACHRIIRTLSWKTPALPQRRWLGPSLPSSSRGARRVTGLARAAGSPIQILDSHWECLAYRLRIERRADAEELLDEMFATSVLIDGVPVESRALRLEGGVVERSPLQLFASEQSLVTFLRRRGITTAPAGLRFLVATLPEGTEVEARGYRDGTWELRRLAAATGGEAYAGGQLALTASGRRGELSYAPTPGTLSFTER